MQPVAGEPEITVQSDLETWFNAPAGRSGTAPRYKMMLLTWIAIYPTVLAFSLLLQRVPYVFHPAVSTLVVTGLTVLLASYIVLPGLRATLRALDCSAPSGPSAEGCPRTMGTFS